MLQPGSNLGKFEIVDILGQGGMGTVYRARDHVLGRVVAIKVIPDSAQSKETMARFRREAMVVAQLVHPNILAIHDIVESEGTTFLVMPFVRGRTLARLIEENPASIPLPSVKTVLEQVASALDFAYSQGVVHRDVKPSNIMIEDGTDQVFLMDFGIAQARADNTRLTQTGHLIGSIGYMAPEQIDSKKLDGRADQYALALIAFEMLTGKLPFSGESGGALLWARMQTVPPLVTEFRHDLPMSLARSVARALSKNPDERFTSTADFVRSAFTAGAPRRVSFPRESPELPAASPPRRSISVSEALRSLIRPFLSLFRGQAVKREAPIDAAQWISSKENSDTQPFFSSSRQPTSPPRSRESATTWIGAAAPALLLPTQPPSPITQSAPIPPFPANSTTRELPSKTSGLLSAALSAGRFSAATQSLRAPPSPVSPAAHQTTGAYGSSADRGGSTQVFRFDRETGGVPGHADPPEVVEERHPVQLVFKISADVSLVGQSVDVRTIPFRIGRGDEADLTISADEGVSRIHAEILWHEGTYLLRDMGSRNGTFVQGRRVSANNPEPLRFGASIRLTGSTELTLVAAGGTTAPDLTGAMLGGRYSLVRLIRKTGKSSLYEASDARLPHQVAIKVLSPVLAHYPGYLEDFQHEARMAAELQHPHILRVLDSGAEVLTSPSPFTCHYVCVELVPEGDLTDRLRALAAIPLAEALEILDGVSAALHYAHSLGTVHRGLKPSSILFGHNHFAFVSDFAFAARSNDLNRRMFLGAPDFLAPEQWENRAVTAAADQYSLAALTYLMLTGAPPFRGQQDPDIRGDNLSRGPKPVHQEASRKGSSDIPPAVSAVLAKALSSEPADRYPSVREYFLQLKYAGTLRAAVPNGPPSVFISYQRDTSAGWAVLFGRELQQKHGITAFVDTQRTDGAVNFPARLTRAIQESDIFVCLLSDKTLTSGWVREEVRLAWENKKPMVPVFQESFEHPLSGQQLDTHIEALISFEGVHLLDRRNIYVDDAISRLAKIVEQSVRQVRDTPQSFY